MKKLICTILALATAMTLCACGSKEDDDTPKKDKKPNQQTESMENPKPANPFEDLEPTEATEPTLPLEPTEEEKEAMLKYIELVHNLNSNCKDLEAAPYANSTLQDISNSYKTLLEMDKSVIDIWANTEWAEKIYNENKDGNPNFNHPADWNFDNIQSRFATIKNAKLTYTSTTVDNLGNAGDASTLSKWYYNADGSLRAMYGEMKAQKISLYSYYSLIDANLNHLYEYDAQGRVSKITYYYAESFRAGDISSVRIFTYDDQGHLDKMTVQHNTSSNVYDYTSDAAGRITKITWTDSYEKFEINNTYDGTGRLIREDKATIRTKDDAVTKREIMEYTYDNTGKLTEGTYTENSYQHGNTQNGLAWYISSQTISKFSYVYDAQDNLVQEIMVPGDTISYNGMGEIRNTQPASYSQINYVTTYGDYYVYTPAQ